MKLQRPNLILIAIAVCWLVAYEPVIAQQPSTEPQIIKGDANSCEANSSFLDALTNEHRSTNERVFVIARLGRGEANRALSLNRLERARWYLVEPGRIKSENVVFAEGARINGEGRVEFYLGSKLFLVSLAERGMNVCLTCCDDYVPTPRRKRRLRRRR